MPTLTGLIARTNNCATSITSTDSGAVPELCLPATESEIITEKWDSTVGTWPKNILKADQLANLNINQRINRTHRHVPVTEAMRILVEENGKAAAK